MDGQLSPNKVTIHTKETRDGRVKAGFIPSCPPPQLPGLGLHRFPPKRSFSGDQFGSPMREHTGTVKQDSKDMVGISSDSGTAICAWGAGLGGGIYSDSVVWWIENPSARKSSGRSPMLGPNPGEGRGSMCADGCGWMLPACRAMTPDHKQNSERKKGTAAESAPAERQGSDPGLLWCQV